MSKIKIILTVIITTMVLGTVGNLIPLFKQHKSDDRMIHHELIIRDTGKYSGLYVDEINADRGQQAFGLSVDVKRNNLHVYVLAHKSSEYQVNEFVKWLVSYYGAEEAGE